MSNKKIVIYDSLYGNTQKIAQTISKSISARLIKVSDASFDDLKDLDFLVVGSPTQGGKGTTSLMNFLNNIPNKFIKNLKFASFDTRFSESNLNIALRLLVKAIGYAAPKMAEILEAKGGKPILPPKGFIVVKTKGPLSKGELDRAKKWLS